MARVCTVLKSLVASICSTSVLIRSSKKDKRTETLMGEQVDAVFSYAPHLRFDVAAGNIQQLALTDPSAARHFPARVF
jgi:hypothetical protein